MKKIKALAILMAITLTFSMFATAASAVDNVTIYSNNPSATPASIGNYTFEDFKKTITNAKYAALFDFEGVVSATTSFEKVDFDSLKGDIKIKGSDSTEKCALGFPSTATAAFRVNDSKGNTNYASGNSCMTIDSGASVTLEIGGTDTLKPVAIGYILNQHSKQNTAFANDVTVTLSGVSVPVDDLDWDMTSSTMTPRFYGYKAPLGKYIDSITISAADSTGRLRIDDLCIIYDDVSRINTGVRFYKSTKPKVDFYDVSGLKNTDITGNVMTEVSSEYAGKKIIMAVYGDNGLIDVNISTEDGQLVVGNSLNNSQIANLTHIKTFIWDAVTLVPACPAATLE